jgi:hypothetical protein
MVDKDLNEIKILQREFPEARVLICHSRVLAYLEKVRHKPEFGKLSEHDHVAIQNHIHRMVYSEIEVQYEANKAALVGTCERMGAHEYVAYLVRNWFNCTEMWALFTRAKLPHLKNHTNNRLESWFGKFKEGVGESTSMHDCVKALIEESRRSKNDYEMAVFRPGRFHNENYDDEMAAVLMCTTPYVAKILEHQYLAAKNKFEQYAYEEDDANQSAAVRGRNSVNVVDLLDFACESRFAKTIVCLVAMRWRTGRPPS